MSSRAHAILSFFSNDEIMAADHTNFYQILEALLCTDNALRTEAEVCRNWSRTGGPAIATAGATGIAPDACQLRLKILVSLRHHHHSEIGRHRQRAAQHILSFFRVPCLRRLGGSEMDRVREVCVQRARVPWPVAVCMSGCDVDEGVFLCECVCAECVRRTAECD